MTSPETEQSQNRYARLAGFMFLFVIVADLLGMFITARFDVPGDFTETIHRNIAGESLYRIGLSCGLLGSLCTILLAMGLYVTIKPIDNNIALLALLFRLAEAAIGGVQNLFSFVVLNMYIGGDRTSALSARQLSGFVSSTGFNIGAIFFSIGSILFFYLFLKSNYIPKILSGFGLFASALVTIVSFAALILPQHAKALQLGWLPIALAEVSVGLWLLFKGVNAAPRGN